MFEDIEELLRCTPGLPESGKVIIVESIVPESSQISSVSRNISTIDVVMYNLFPGAKERTMEEFNVLAIGAGFGTIKVICRAYCYWVIEFYKTM